jgi:tripartite-type tricarboxylate transporter receptor subunit TctC
MRIGRRAMMGAMLAAPALAAPDYPSRPVRLVVGYPAGGSTDLVARLLAERLFKAWGQPVTVENRGGAAGTLGADLVAKAAPDGYTLLVGASAEMAIARAVMRSIPYQPEDFAPVALLTEQPFLVLVNAALPVRSLAELVALAREQPGRLNYASHGTGTANHLLTELLRVETGIGITHIPYRGGGPAMIDLIGGRIDYVCNIISTAVQPLEAKQVKALATLARERSPVLPTLSTAHEQGLRDFDAYTWNAIFLPKGASAEIVGKLNAALGKMMDNPVVREKLEGLGLYVVAPERRSPAYLAKFVVNEIDKWAGPIKASGATGE